MPDNLRLLKKYINQFLPKTVTKGYKVSLSLEEKNQFARFLQDTFPPNYTNQNMIRWFVQQLGIRVQTEKNFLREENKRIAENIYDWVVQHPNYSQRKINLFDYTWDQAAKEQRQWHQKIKKLKAKTLTPSSEKIDRDFPPVLKNGKKYYFVELTTPNDLAEEGKLMGHCVGSYDYLLADGYKFYSLRELSKENKESGKATLTITNKGEINELKGKANAVPLKYADILRDFIKTKKFKIGLKTELPDMLPLLQEEELTKALEVALKEVTAQIKEISEEIEKLEKIKKERWLLSYKQRNLIVSKLSSLQRQLEDIKYDLGDLAHNLKEAKIKEIDSEIIKPFFDIYPLAAILFADYYEDENLIFEALEKGTEEEGGDLDSFENLSPELISKYAERFQKVLWKSLEKANSSIVSPWVFYKIPDEKKDVRLIKKLIEQDPRFIFSLPSDQISYKLIKERIKKLKYLCLGKDQIQQILKGTTVEQVLDLLENKILYFDDLPNRFKYAPPILMFSFYDSPFAFIGDSVEDPKLKDFILKRPYILIKAIKKTPALISLILDKLKEIPEDLKKALLKTAVKKNPREAISLPKQELEMAGLNLPSLLEMIIRSPEQAGNLADLADFRTKKIREWFNTEKKVEVFLDSFLTFINTKEARKGYHKNRTMEEATKRSLNPLREKVDKLKDKEDELKVLEDKLKDAEDPKQKTLIHLEIEELQKPESRPITVEESSAFEKIFSGKKEKLKKLLPKKFHRLINKKFKELEETLEQLGSFRPHHKRKLGAILKSIAEELGYKKY